MVKIMKKLVKSTICIGVLSLIAACGGGGGSASDTTSTTTTASLSGVAFDGYLYKALACLDINSNFTCDVDEPFATTDENGKFTLPGVTAEMSQAHSILVMALKDVTIDQDNPNVPISSSYFLTAPAGMTNLSPFTTLLKAAAVANSDDEYPGVFNLLKKMLTDGLVTPDFANHVAAVTMVHATTDYIVADNKVLKSLGWALRKSIEGIPNNELMNVIYSSFSEYIAPNADAIL